MYGSFLIMEFAWFGYDFNFQISSKTNGSIFASMRETRERREGKKRGICNYGKQLK